MFKLSKTVCFVLFFLCVKTGFVFTQVLQAPNQQVRDSVARALSANSVEVIISNLTKASLAQETGAEKKYILAILASYEEGLGDYTLAAKHYLEAAWVESQRDWSLSLDAARCFIALGEHEQADIIIKAVLLGSFDHKELVRARVYGIIVQLSGLERAQALVLCDQYSKNPDFSEYAPMLLFILWWSEENEEAKQKLLKEWPGSPEAMILQKKINLVPNSFWYLMERNSSLFEDFSKTAKEFSTPITQSQQLSKVDMLEFATKEVMKQIEPETILSGLWQQTGFFKNLAYAEELKKKLVDLGFPAILRSEIRSSGIEYYSVLVPETEDRSTGAKLKNAGFECSLVIDD